MAHQSGEPLGDVKDEGMKNANTPDGLNTKKDDYADEEEFETGGSNKGGKVPGAFGKDDQADGHKSLEEGM
jgi:hypothetical protein